MDRSGLSDAARVVAIACALASGVSPAPSLHAQSTQPSAQAPPAPPAPLGAADESFQTLMQRAMVRMHADMDVAPTGDPDRDFARLMIPHHQGAIDMALAELRFGKDERLRRLAQEIIVEQTQEIQLMRSILGDGAAPR